MLMKLIMPGHGRGVEGASVVKWHKREGERVHEGDRLLDVKLEERTIIKPPSGLRQLIETLTDPQFAARVAASGEQTSYQAEEPGSVYTKVKLSGSAVLIRASEAGTLRRIHAREGEYYKVGRLLALLTTEDNEALADEDQALEGAGVFRITPERVRGPLQG